MLNSYETVADKKTMSTQIDWVSRLSMPKRHRHRIKGVHTMATEYFTARRYKQNTLVFSNIECWNLTKN